MIEPSLALQIAIRTRLISSPAVTDLVPALHIRDGGGRPEIFPCIIIGGGQTVLEGVRYTSWRNVTAYADVHVWTTETGLETAKTIAFAVWNSIGTTLDVPDFLLSDGVHVENAHYQRDATGKQGHGILQVSAFMGWAL